VAKERELCHETITGHLSLQKFTSDSIWNATCDKEDWEGGFIDTTTCKAVVEEMGLFQIQ
jgi:hypothetical protein